MVNKPSPSSENNSIWELENSHSNEPQELEDTFTKYVGGMRLLPEKTETSSSILNTTEQPLDLVRQPTTRKDLITNIASIPIVVWETIRYLTEHYSDMRYGKRLTKADVEGILIHVGLHVLEPVLNDLLRTVEDRDKAYLNGNMGVLSRYAHRNYKLVYMVPGIGQTRGIFCLNDQDYARANDVANHLGWPLATAITMMLIVAIAQGKGFLPDYAVKKARKEIENLKEWIKRSY